MSLGPRGSSFLKSIFASSPVVVSCVRHPSASGQPPGAAVDSHTYCAGGGGCFPAELITGF